MYTTTRTFRPCWIGVGGTAPLRHKHQPTIGAHRDQTPTLRRPPRRTTNHTSRGRLRAETPPPVVGIHHNPPLSCKTTPKSTSDAHHDQQMTTSNHISASLQARRHTSTKGDVEAMSHHALCRGGRVLNALPRTKVVFYIELRCAASLAMEAANTTAQGLGTPIEGDTAFM
jgi:hypothetical protein